MSLNSHIMTASVMEDMSKVDNVWTDANIYSAPHQMSHHFKFESGPVKTLLRSQDRR